MSRQRFWFNISLSGSSKGCKLISIPGSLCLGMFSKLLWQNVRFHLYIGSVRLQCASSFSGKDTKRHHPSGFLSPDFFILSKLTVSNFYPFLMSCDPLLQTMTNITFGASCIQAGWFCFVFLSKFLMKASHHSRSPSDIFYASYNTQGYSMEGLYTLAFLPTVNSQPTTTLLLSIVWRQVASYRISSYIKPASNSLPNTCKPHP